MNLPPILRWLLWPFSLVYGIAVRLRVWLYARGILPTRRLCAPVVSVGNLTVGGTGKTPLVILLAERFLAAGKCVAILSRGYKGSGDASDEIEMMKYRLRGRALFGVGANRYEQGCRLEQQGVDMFLLDDGFQHLQLARDMNILLLDGSRLLKNERLLPAGELREPFSAMRRADLILVTRREEHRAIEARDSDRRSIFYAQTQLLGFRSLEQPDEEQYLSEIGPGPFFAFCAIGNPDAFLQDLARWHIPVCGQSYFRDHHRYDQSDLKSLEISAKERGAVGFVTTEKDWVNLRSAGKLSLPTYLAAISLSIQSEGEFLACLERKLQSLGART